jgi:GT2 family glycosyltransferase/glycosyltransferase involved in cell wall biosynthesis
LLWRSRGLKPNALFDPIWYLKHNADVRRRGIDPLDHYLYYGGFEGRDPSPGFDSDWYLATNPDVAAAGVNPLLHYLRDGRTEGRPPRPQGVDQPTINGVAQHWVDHHDEWESLTLDHGHAPHANGIDPMLSLFDVDAYLAESPDAAASGLSPLGHYRTIGAAAGRSPNTVFDVAAYRYDHPGVAQHEDDPLLHYVEVGREVGATPHPLFDPDWYRRHNPDIGGRDPYEHYLRVGRAEGRAPSRTIPERVDIANLRTVLPQASKADARVTIVIPAYGNAALTLRCLHSVARHTPASLGVRVILADDDPQRPLGPLLEDVEGLELIANARNLGFLRNCNSAARQATGEYVVFLNTDTEVTEGWLEALVEVADRDPRVGMVGVRLVDPAGRLQEAGVVMFQDGWGYPYGRGDDPAAPQYRFVREVDAVTGACFLVRREAWDAVSGFEKAFAPAFFEEYDLAFKLAAAGWKIVYQPAATVIHRGSASYGTELRDRQSSINHARFVSRWKTRLAERYEGPADLFLARDRRPARSIVLVVDDKVPEHDRHAGALTMDMYVRLLVEEGFRVVYLPDDGLERQPYTDRLRQLGVEVLTGHVDAERWIVDNGVHLDHAILARPRVAPKYLTQLRRRSRARVLYYPHDVHFLRERRRYETTGDGSALGESEELREIEQALFRRVDCVLAPSLSEVDVIRELAPDAEVRVIPPYFYRAAQELPDGPPLTERRDIAFLGAFDHLPNVDAARVLVREIMPKVWARIPDAKVILVGDFVPPSVQALAGRRVEVAGFVPDLAAVWGRARVSVSPLRYGSGVKGKIVASLQAGVPVVTTSVGNEGIALEPGVEALIGETPAELAAHVIRLYEEPEVLVALASAAAGAITGRYSWDRAREDLFSAMHVEPDGPAR